MIIRAVFFDFGGVIVRTEHQAPRERLAQRLNMTYEDLVKLVFESGTSRQASLGALSVEAHWAAIMRRLNLPVAETETVKNEFFAGDVIDRCLIDFIRSLRPQVRTGLVSNAWGDLRDYIVSEKCDDAFDIMIISAEVGIMKPDARIYQMALERAGVAAAEAVFVDDMAENVTAAQAVGMVGIQFKQPEKAFEELKQLLANHK